MIAATTFLAPLGEETLSRAQENPLEGSFYIREYRVVGSTKLNGAEIGETVYPFLGPGRTADDVEAARTALEKAFHEKGYQTVSVEIPEQNPKYGIIQLKVHEAPVGRLRVRGSRYFSLSDIKKRVPSLAEGSVPNFNDITREIVALNHLPDRRVTPDLKPGVEPGTVDIDLNVKDTLPLHGSIELNNRYSANTTELRLAGSLSYNNLWQLGHSLGVSFNVAPERPEDATILSAYYLVRFPTVPWLTVNLHGTKQESDIVVPQGLTSLQVVSPGETIGIGATMTLPGLEGFYHSITFGFDYKHYEEATQFGLVQTTTPISYYPASIGYDAAWFGKGRMTQFGTTVTYHHRGLGSDPREFDAKRYRATGGFIKLEAELEHTQDLKYGAQIYGRVRGQAANQPLINTEQMAGGGLDSVRGYLESEVLGDNGLFGTLELRSPSLLGWWDKEANDHEWRVYGFFDIGYLTINQPLPEENSRWNFASYGFGSRIKLFDYFDGSLDAGLPLINQGQTLAGDLHLTFRVWAEF